MNSYEIRSYEDIRDEVRRVHDYALSSPKAAEEL